MTDPMPRSPGSSSGTPSERDAVSRAGTPADATGSGTLNDVRAGEEPLNEEPLNEEERLAEERRLRTLYGYNILDTPAKEEFDRITRLATYLFDVPIAMINFIDQDDQWCLAGEGMEVDRVARDISFCPHAIETDGVTVVPDTREDPRFADNPFVTGDPNIRFYAAAPLTAPNGYRLGTICIVDDAPREAFPERDCEALRELADVVMDALNLRHYAYNLDNVLEAQATSDTPAAQVLESITDAFFALDDDWNFTYVNAQAERLLDRSRTELIGRDIWDEFDEAVGSTFYEEYHRATAHQETVEFLEHYPPMDKWFEVKAFPFFGGLSVYFDDVTERIEAQENLRRERDLTEAIIDTSIAAIVILDPDGTLEFVNDRASDVLSGASGEGANLDEGRPIYTLDGEEIPLDDWPFYRVMKTGEPVEDQQFVINADKGERIVSVNGAPLYTPEGAIRKVVFSIVDITDRVEQQQALAEAKEEAERASRLKTSFLANLSHDVRSPIAAIMSLSAVLRQEVPDDCAERVHLIERSGQRLLDILDSVLELSKIESGSIDLEMRPVNIAEEVEEAAALFRPQAREKGVAFETEGVVRDASGAAGEEDVEDSSADPSDEALTRPLDPKMLRRILDNLIGNALKFTDPGDTITVRAFARLQSGNGPEAVSEAVGIEVEDTGVGIEEAFLPDLFEAFSRSPEQALRDGSGLGLAITKRLTEHMGGTIDVESEKGVGTTFTVRFPR